MPVRTKGTVYKTAIRPAILYGTETWAAKNVHTQKLHTAEMRMLRWSSGVTLKDKVRNEYIRGSLKVAPITDKLAETRLRWYGHVMRRPEDFVVKKCLSIATSKRGSGRPPATWLTTVQRDMKTLSLQCNDVYDRNKWCDMIKKADPV
ncbi:uncharacterized protein LOC125242006 [Leguminivora glycinivorella]|uniref:uncharacterized protein LOC125242006 n=1 Tax=Leguminivora glycinivorella TaxID=1035111 RepID=UPI00200DEA97|nr:uncharacterized protein LOC125242006 [Leguminivora glycinivorella]